MAFEFFKRMFSSRKRRKEELQNATMNKTFSDLNIRVGSSITMDTSNFLMYNSSLDFNKIQSTETVDYILEYELFDWTIHRFVFKSKNYLQIVKMDDGINEVLYFTESHSEIVSDWDEVLGADGLLYGSEIVDDEGNTYEKAWSQKSVHFTAELTNSENTTTKKYETMMFYRNIESIHDSEELTDELLMVEAIDGTRLSMFIGLELDFSNIKVL